MGGNNMYNTGEKYQLPLKDCYFYGRFIQWSVKPIGHEVPMGCKRPPFFACIFEIIVVSL